MFVFGLFFSVHHQQKEGHLSTSEDINNPHAMRYDCNQYLPMLSMANDNGKCHPVTITAANERITGSLHNSTFREYPDSDDGDLITSFKQ